MSGAVRIPAWRYPLLVPYNGFTGLERARGAQLIWWAVKAGILQKSDRCSICGKPPSRLQFHSEDYYDPLHPHAICATCHMLLHRRFRSPAPWQTLVAKHARAGAWFMDLDLTPINLASELRGLHGEETADILARLVAQLPPDAPRPIGSLVQG